MEAERSGWIQENFGTQTGSLADGLVLALGGGAGGGGAAGSQCLWLTQSSL